MHGGFELFFERGDAWAQLPAWARIVCGAEAVYVERMLHWSFERCRPWEGNPMLMQIIAERTYYSELVQYLRARLRLYPHHLSAAVVSLTTILPYDYYRQMIVDHLKAEKPYDLIPNFTAVDVAVYVGITRNSYIATLSEARKHLLWRLNKSIAREMLPTPPPPVVEPWFVVHVVPHRYEATNAANALPGTVGAVLYAVATSAGGPDSIRTSSTGTLTSVSKTLPSPSEVSTTPSAPTGGGGGGPSEPLPTTISQSEGVSGPDAATRPLAAAGGTAGAHRKHRLNVFFGMVSRGLSTTTGWKAASSQYARRAGARRRDRLAGDGVLAGALPRGAVVACVVRGLAYLTVEVVGSDVVVVPAMSTMIVNRQAGDLFEGLLYQVLVVADCHRTVSDIARVLQRPLYEVKVAVSVLLRQGHLRRRNLDILWKAFGCPLWNTDWGTFASYCGTSAEDVSKVGGGVAVGDDGSRSVMASGGGDGGDGARLSSLSASSSRVVDGGVEVRGGSEGVVGVGDVVQGVDVHQGMFVGGGTRRRGAVVVDVGVSAYLMMGVAGSKSDALKGLAVTLFEGGRLAPQFVLELCECLERVPSSLLGGGDASSMMLPTPQGQGKQTHCCHPMVGVGGVLGPLAGDAGMFVVHCVTLSNTLRTLDSMLRSSVLKSTPPYDPSTSSGVPPSPTQPTPSLPSSPQYACVEFVRAESLEALPPHPREGFLCSTYDVLLPVSGSRLGVPRLRAGVSPPTAPYSAGLTSADSRSVWFLVFLTGGGVPHLAKWWVCPAGTRMQSLPSAFTQPPNYINALTGGGGGGIVNAVATYSPPSSAELSALASLCTPSTASFRIGPLNDSYLVDGGRPAPYVGALKALRVVGGCASDGPAAVVQGPFSCELSATVGVVWPRSKRGGDAEGEGSGSSAAASLYCQCRTSTSLPKGDSGVCPFCAAAPSHSSSLPSWWPPTPTAVASDTLPYAAALQLLSLSDSLCAQIDEVCDAVESIIPAHWVGVLYITILLPMGPSVEQFFAAYPTPLPRRGRWVSADEAALAAVTSVGGAGCVGGEGCCVGVTSLPCAAPSLFASHHRGKVGRTESSVSDDCLCLMPTDTVEWLGMCRPVVRKLHTPMCVPARVECIGFRFGVVLSDVSTNVKQLVHAFEQSTFAEGSVGAHLAATAQLDRQFDAFVGSLATAGIDTFVSSRRVKGK